MRSWKRWEDWTVVVLGLIMALTPIWGEHLGNSVPMMITSGTLLVIVGLVNLGGPNLYGVEVGQLLASVVAIILPWLGRFAGANVPAVTAWIVGGVSLIATILAFRPSINASHDHYFEMRRS